MAWLCGTPVVVPGSHGTQTNDSGVPAIVTQVKDIMAHLYFKAKESFARQAPKEVRAGLAIAR